MSDLLRQALADSKKLKEAARKSVEKVILEKYNREVRESIDKLLESSPVYEQEDPEEEMPDMQMDPSMGMDPTEADPFVSEPMDMGGEEKAPVQVEYLDDVPHAASGGEKMCQCPEKGLDTCQCPTDDKEIVIYLDDLMGQPEEPYGMDGLGVDTFHDQMAMDIAPEAPTEEEDGDSDYALEEDHSQFVDGYEELPYDYHEPGRERPDSDEDIYKEILGLFERTYFEQDSEKNGWSTSNSPEIDFQYDRKAIKNNLDDEPPAPEEERQKQGDDLASFLSKNSKFISEIVDSVLSEELGKLEENYRKKYVLLNNELTRYKEVVEKLQKNFQQVNEANAKLNFENSKLFYINEVYESNFLNGRQKSSVVSKIAEAKNPRDARLIYETVCGKADSAGIITEQRTNQTVPNRTEIKDVVESRKGMPAFIKESKQIKQNKQESQLEFFRERNQRLIGANKRRKQ